MTLTDLMPIRLGWRDRPVRKHRAVDEVERLQHRLAGAQLLIGGLHLQLDDRDRAHAETVARIDERYTATIRELEERLAEMEQRLSVGVLAEAAAAVTQEMPIITVPVPVPLHQAPFATTNPGRVKPSWTFHDDEAELAGGVA
ncbi:hypothetical protein [Streptomyces kaempferi]|uniref:Uncharacterized protein n=1 Tax=Streptomyces kaempferi TaxID=333725 RepID=A0ABW3XEK5_9ACTN